MRSSWVLALAVALACSSQAQADLFIPVSGSDTVVATFGDDFSTGPHALGFTFPFFGVDRTAVFMNSNGNLTFGSGNTAFANVGFPAAGTPPRIAPIWDDLFLPPGNMRINALTPGVFVATWNGVGIFAEPPGVTAQAVLLGAGNPYAAAPGTIVFSYDAITNTSGTITAGIGSGAVFATLASVLGTAANGILTEAQALSLLPNTVYTFTPTGPTTYSVAAGGPTVIPEPGSLTLLGLGALGLAGYIRRRK